MQETFLKFISLGSIFVLFLCFLCIVLGLFRKNNKIKKVILQNRLYLIFFVSLGATVGSLLLSIYFKLAACELCWYQRLFLFTIPVITYIAILKKDTIAHAYAFWLSCIGMVIALYHALLQLKIFAPDSVFCNPNSTVDCAVPAFMYFGFVTVPVISLSVFLLLAILSYEYKKI